MFKKIYLEITNYCNLNCRFCGGSKRRKSFITKEDFRIILDKLKGYTKYLYLHLMGEPLMHPDINELIDEASEEYFINITTNGYLIDKIGDNKNIRQVNISLQSFDGTSKILLEEYMDKIFKNVDKLVCNGTYINYRMWVESDYREDIIRMLENKYMITFDGNKSIKLADKVYFSVEKEFVWPNYDNEYNNEKGSCLGLRDHIGILVDGTIVPCCLDSNGEIELGNIYKQNLDDIINSEKFMEMKKGFLNNKKIHPLCQKCNFYDLRKNSN